MSSRISHSRIVDGETIIEEIEIQDDVMPEGGTHPEMLEEQRAAIIAEMDRADIRIIRARLEGDAERIAAHVEAQAERRARLRALG